MSHRRTSDAPARTAGLRFECTQCGKCCTKRGKHAHVYVSEEEIRALADVLGITVRRFRRRYTFVDDYGWDQVRFEGDTCPFLEVTSNRCKVYEARPVQCRTFPFWDEMVDRRGWTEAARAYCEGLGQGRVWPKAEVEAAMREMRETD